MWIGNVGVYLSGGNVAMAKEALDASEVCSVH